MKQIPIQLLGHLRQTQTSYCFLVRVECQGKWSGTTIGFTNCDINLKYDDGDGVVEYKADNGFTPSALQSNSEMDVDNAALTGWVTNDEITERDILSGIFDYARVTIYRVNYMDLTMGHEVVSYGTCGETKFTDQSWSTEWRSLSQQARQTIGQVYSLTCRARFGDARCKKAFIWTTSTVTAQSTDSTRSFYSQSISQPDHWYEGGVVEWTSGKNDGAQMEVETFENVGGDQLIRLALPMPYAIEAGDTFMIRRDCNKTFTQCQEYGNILNFRGEHLTPVADQALSVPGANVKSVEAK